MFTKQLINSVNSKYKNFRLIVSSRKDTISDEHCAKAPSSSFYPSLSGVHSDIL